MFLSLSAAVSLSLPFRVFLFISGNNFVDCAVDGLPHDDDDDYDDDTRPAVHPFSTQTYTGSDSIIVLHCHHPMSDESLDCGVARRAARLSIVGNTFDMEQYIV